jgi:Reverse transcriptase (RNA-dependent DNA polymerase)
MDLIIFKGENDVQFGKNVIPLKTTRLKDPPPAQLNKYDSDDEDNDDDYQQSPVNYRTRRLTVRRNQPHQPTRAPPCDQELKRKPITTKWVFKKKAQQDGSIRYRARCVARGFMQIPGVDFTESFAPMASDTSIKLVIGIYLYLQNNIQSSTGY